MTCRGVLANTVPEDEEVDAMLEEHCYRHKGRPGIYKVAVNSGVQEMNTRFALKSDIERVLAAKEGMSTINVYALDHRDDRTLRYDGDYAAAFLFKLQHDPTYQLTFNLPNTPSAVIYSVDDDFVDAKGRSNEGSKLKDSIISSFNA